MQFNLFKKNKAKEWNRKGNKFFREGNYQKAIEYYEKALEIDPKYQNALNNMV